MHLRVTFSGRTDVGRVRTRNEDTFLVEEDRGLAVVADGMGGHPGGDVASAVAADAAAATLRVWVGERRGSPPGESSWDALGDTMAVSVMDAHQAVRREAARRPDLQGMGTTLTAFLLDPATGRWGVGHAGDSRAYLLREDGLEQITRDDTWVQAQVESGRMSPSEAHGHPASHVLQQCVGLETPPEPRRYTGEGRPGDRFLLCSDGLTDMLEEEEIAAILSRADTPDDATRRMVERALEEGGVDNVTVVVAALASSEG